MGCCQASRVTQAVTSKGDMQPAPPTKAVPPEAILGKDARDVWKVYEQQQRLGSGAFGTVYQAKDKETGRCVALKKLDLTGEASTHTAAIDEFKLCAQVSHPHIMRVFAFYTAPNAVYIASELAARGEFLDVLHGDPELANEAVIAKVASQVLSALVFLHGLPMIHHDVKPANILVIDQQCSDAPRVPVVVLGDFGTARLSQSTARVEHSAHAGQEVGVLGTPEYCGPEVFQGQSGDRTDVYALGVTLFELLSGEKPFEQYFDMWGEEDANTEASRFHQMADVSYEADWSYLRGCSEEARALIQRMMAKPYEQRPSAADCAKESWFAGEKAADAGTASKDAQLRVKRLQQRARLCVVGKAILNMVAAQLSGEALQRERELFQKLDLDGSGQISADELLQAFRSKGWDSNRAEAALKLFDLDKSGSLSFNEWMAATMDLESRDGRGLLLHVKELFAQLDQDGNGQIELGEIRKRLCVGDDVQEEALQKFFAEVDTNGDGTISLAELERFWTRSVRTPTPVCC
mmetsp:Transcript_31770/g.62436  ORF Transcript_31770/g.62436 Transcript_31770/m.62436 type:complete len:521 (+) Transcript_31770:57-1619(+)